MSANIGSMLYVGETPWHGLGKHYATPPSTAAEIIEGAKLGWTVGAAPMTAEIIAGQPSQVQKYHAIYREDNHEILGVVNKPRIQLVQNADMFTAIEPMLGDYITTETAASLGLGEKVFACFEIQEKYRILDDEISQYFVVVNEHSRSDGAVTILNTPIRVVCQNTLSQALHNNQMKMRVKCEKEAVANNIIMDKIRGTAMSVQSTLKKRAETLVKKQVSREFVDKMLDELFPIIVTPTDFESSHDRANQKMELLRETFVKDCLGAENLQNYRGTAWQVFNACTDYFQHYHSDMYKAYDLDFRMNTLPGLGIHESIGKVGKAIKMLEAA